MSEANRILMLDDEVDNKTLKPIIDAIFNINKEDDDKDSKEKDFKRQPIKLYLATPGGQCYSGWNLVSIIENSKTPIHTYTSGYAMSMGLPIALSGHKRYASKYSTFMYHGVSNGVWGMLPFMENRLDETKRLQEQYDKYILNKTSIKQKDLDYYVERQLDWFISSEEALKLGIVDELI